MDARTTTSILILEDEPLIALDHDLHVQSAGFTQTTIISSCAAALDWLQSSTPSIALLDIRLRDGTCCDIVNILNERGIPFVVCSGSARENVDPAFRTGIWISKPCISEDLISALVRGLSKGGQI